MRLYVLESCATWSASCLESFTIELLTAGLCSQMHEYLPLVVMFEISCWFRHPQVKQVIIIVAVCIFVSTACPDCVWQCVLSSIATVTLVHCCSVLCMPGRRGIKCCIWLSASVHAAASYGSKNYQTQQPHGIALIQSLGTHLFPAILSQHIHTDGH